MEVIKDKTLFEELDKLRSTPVSEKELQKAKNTAVADFYRSMKTIGGKADLLGVYEVVYGDYRELFKTVDRISAVTRDDVQRVAKKYFEPRNRTIGILLPEDSEQPAADTDAAPQASPSTSR